jgi:hypothetical protein
MPRKSRNDIPSVHELDRPKPPANLNPEAAAIWNCVVGSMRPSWFGPESFDLLGRYCFSMAESVKLEGEMIAMPLTDPMRPRVVRQYKEMSSLALSYGRALRLAPKDHKQSTIDGRDDGHSPGGRRMKNAWELGQDDEPAPRGRRMPNAWEL